MKALHGVGCWRIVSTFSFPEGSQKRYIQAEPAALSPAACLSDLPAHINITILLKLPVQPSLQVLDLKIIGSRWMGLRHVVLLHDWRVFKF
jgi:hypothetical protein